MRAFLFTVGLFALWTLVAAWSKEDQEIFRLRDEIAISEGHNVTFYDFIGVGRSASLDEINKAYKKMSKALHPDKVKQRFISERLRKDKSQSKKQGTRVSKKPSQAEIRAVTKAASKQFERLGLVIAILRGPDRDRYDHFLANGFPKWKGTGYYYARFRPGLGSVLFGLFIFVGGVGHYLTLYMSWKRQQDFVGRYIKFAKHAAWGDSLGIPGISGAPTPSIPNTDSEVEAAPQPRNRRERRMQEKESRKDRVEKKIKSVKPARSSPAVASSGGPIGQKKRVVAENGKILVVDSVGNVYLEEQDEEGQTHEFLLDPNELPKPTIRNTALYRMPAWLYNCSIGRFTNKARATEESESTDDEDLKVEDETETDGNKLQTEMLGEGQAVTSNSNGNVVRRKKSPRRW